MYAQIVFSTGFNCKNCGRAVFPRGRLTVGQVVDRETGAAAVVPDEGTAESGSHHLEVDCAGCGASTVVVLDGADCRIERQSNVPSVVDPVYLVQARDDGTDCNRHRFA